MKKIYTEIGFNHNCDYRFDISNKKEDSNIAIMMKSLNNPNGDRVHTFCIQIFKKGRWLWSWPSYQFKTYFGDFLFDNQIFDRWVYGRLTYCDDKMHVGKETRA